MNFDTSAAVQGPLVEEIPWGLQEQEQPLQVNEHSTLGLVELLLKDPHRADSLNRQEGRQSELMPRFLGIALASYALFAAAMILMLNTAPAQALPHRLLSVPSACWSDGSAVGLLLGYTLGLVATTGVCLPSFYFFGLLAGVRMSMLQVTAQVLRCQATSAIMLVGILPIYVAVVLGMIVFRASPELLEWCLYCGLGLPFVAGLAGVHAIYRSVLGMAETMAAERRGRREPFLRRLTLSWALCYTAVSPVMIYRLWQFFTGQLT